MTILRQPRLARMAAARRLAAVVAGIAALANTVGGCSASGGTDDPSEGRSFDFAGRELTVRPRYGSVHIRETADPGRVTVSRRITAWGRDAGDPRWSLTDSVLDLGPICQKGYIGLCEVDYSIDVPKGTRVRIRNRAPARQ